MLVGRSGPARLRETGPAGGRLCTGRCSGGGECACPSHRATSPPQHPTPLYSCSRPGRKQVGGTAVGSLCPATRRLRSTAGVGGRWKVRREGRGGASSPREGRKGPGARGVRGRRKHGAVPTTELKVFGKRAHRMGPAAGWTRGAEGRRGSSHPGGGSRQKGDSEKERAGRGSGGAV